MSRVCSEDSVRRAFSEVEASECSTWQTRHLRNSYEPLLSEPWILDIDSTVKPLLWAPGRGGERVQPGQAWSPIARVSHLFCGQYSASAGGGSAGRQSDCVGLCAGGGLGIHR